MAKAGEINYLKMVGDPGIAHAVNKPFSDVHCGDYLMAIGLIRKLLPPPRARLLDLGCGTGWSSCLYAKMGYDVVGQDIAPDMVHYANVNKQYYQVENVKFVVNDYEELVFKNEFDGAVFFDALHHAIDERLALTKAFAALKPGGVCITREPGHGHAGQESSIEAMEKYGVTEKDMPPDKIMALGREIGFRRTAVYPFPERLYDVIIPRDKTYTNKFKNVLQKIKQRLRPLKRYQRLMERTLDAGAIVVLTK
jgi:ubiquinone/menaquinone biosynthesis C-methylase UbiE